MASPSAGAPALKYGDVKTVTPSPGEVKGLMKKNNFNKYKYNLEIALNSYNNISHNVNKVKSNEIFFNTNLIYLKKIERYNVIICSRWFGLGDPTLGHE